MTVVPIKPEDPPRCIPMKASAVTSPNPRVQRCEIDRSLQEGPEMPTARKTAAAIRIDAYLESPSLD